MILGISTYTYPWAFGVPGYLPDKPMTGLDLLREAQRLGVQAVQFGDNYPLHQLSAAEWLQLRNEAHQQGIQIQVGTRGLTPDNLKTYIKLAWEAQSPFLRMVIDDGEYKPSIDEVIALIREKLPVLEKAGVVLAIENHDRFSGKDLIQILSQTSLEWVNICLDTTNSFGAGETAGEVLLYVMVPNVVNLHVKDFRANRVAHKMGFVIEGCEPGKGLLDLHELLKIVSNSDRLGTGWLKSKLKRLYPLALTLEQWPPFTGDLTETIAQEARWADAGIDWIKQALTQRS